MRWNIKLWTVLIIAGYPPSLLSDRQPERDKCSALRLLWAWRGALGLCGEQLMKKVALLSPLKLPRTVTITLWPTKEFPGLAFVTHNALLWWHRVSLDACFTAPSTAHSQATSPTRSYVVAFIDHKRNYYFYYYCCVVVGF